MKYWDHSTELPSHVTNFNANGRERERDSFRVVTLDKCSYIWKLRAAQLTQFLGVNLWGQGKMAWRIFLPLRNQRQLTLKIRCARLCLIQILLKWSSDLVWGRYTSPAQTDREHQEFLFSSRKLSTKTPATSFWAEKLQSYWLNL